MKYLLPFLLFLFFFSSQVYSANYDDLKKKAEKENTAKSWNDVAKYLYDKQENPKLLKKATDISMALAQSSADKIEIGRGFIYSSDLFFQEGDINKYLSTNQEALSILIETDNYSLQEEALNNIATAWGEKDELDSLLYYTQKAVDLNIKHNGSLKQLGAEYQNMSYVYSMKGIVDSSLSYTQKTIDVLSNAKDTLRLLDAYNQMGVIYVKSNDYPNALKYFNDALSIYEAVSNKKNRIYVYTNLGAMYQKWGDLNKALEFNRRAVYDAANSTEKITFGKLLCNLGKSLQNLKYYRASTDSLLLAIPLVNSSHYYLGTSCLLLVENYNELNKIDSATYYLNKVDSLASLKQFTRSEVFFIAKAKLLAKQSKYKEAVAEVYEFIKIDKEKGLTETNPEVYDLVSVILEKGSNDYINALYYKKIASSLQDSIYKEKSIESLNKFYTEYQTMEKELQISHLNEEKQEILLARTITVTCLIGLSILLTIAYLYNRIQRYRKEKEALELSKKMEQKEHEYQLLLSESENRQLIKLFEGRELERKSIAKELHDSIAGDVFAIGMLLQSANNDKKVSTLVEDTYNHIRQISHELMPPEFKYMSLIGLIEDRMDILNETQNGVNFKLRIENEEIVDLLEDASNSLKKEIYYIVQEALGNICKHSGAQNAVINILQENNNMILTITDDGAGFDTTLESKGIGIKTMQSRGQSIDVETKIESTDGKGTTISLVCPISLLQDHLN